MGTNNKGTMKVSPIERITLAAFRLADANRAHRQARAERKAIACPDDEDSTPCWKYKPLLLTSDLSDFCEVCLDALPILRQVQATHRERDRAKAYFWRAVAAVKR